MKLFFSCDWGTSTFRLRLADAENANLLSEIKSNHGIAVTFEYWKQSGKNENDRIAFYQAYLFEQVKKMTISFKVSIENIPIVLSGMASSSIGMLELPYKELPFYCDGSDLLIHTMTSKQEVPSQIIIISGAKSEADVIRGEETILAGCDITADDKEQLFLFPGTHSKHIGVKNGLVHSITTYMTGELFDLLSNKSILSASVKKNDQPQSNNDFFAEGVQHGATSSLMNSIFHVRTNQLFNKVNAEDNYHYLSGLLIGHELKELAGNKLTPVTLVCNEGLKKAYLQALNILEFKNLQYKNADVALVNGQRKIIERISS